MNRIDLYHKTVDILYQAYFNDTLTHGVCTACAVGNIVAANKGYAIEKGVSGTLPNGRIFYDSKWVTPNDKIGHCGVQWRYVFMTGVEQCLNPDMYYGKSKEEIDSTGYPWQDLAKIEYAFETVPKGDNDEDYMFNGLVAVLDTLKEIHEITDEESIVKFRKHYETKKVTV